MSLRKVLCLLFFVSLAGALQAAPLRVVALHSVLAECAQKVGGDDVAVVCLVPGGSDPHTFNPSPSDAAAVAKADLVLASGFDLEPYFDRLVANSGTRGVVLRVSDFLADPVLSSGGHEHSHDHGSNGGAEVDPHWWHSIRNVRQASAKVCEALCRLRPDASGRFEARLAAYDRQLKALAAWADGELARLPASRRVLVTSHDAFGYLARDYGFAIRPLLGVNPESEPDARALAALIDFVRSHHIPAVFADNTENPRLLASMLEESGARLGGSLYADGLGPVGSDGATYETMFQHNLRTIVEGLAPRP